MTNAEKFKTAEERTKEFGKWCEKNKIFDSHGNTACAWRCTFCSFAWLDAEAEEEKIENCPYCGGRCFAVESISERTWRVFCEQNISCAYSSGAYAAKDDAIAAHNRVARAVMEKAGGVK